MVFCLCFLSGSSISFFFHLSLELNKLLLFSDFISLYLLFISRVIPVELLSEYLPFCSSKTHWCIFSFLEKEGWAVEDRFFFLTKMIIFNGVQHGGNKCLGAFTEPVSKFTIFTFKYLVFYPFILVFCHFISIAKTDELIWTSRGEQLSFITVKYHHLWSTEVK